MQIPYLLAVVRTVSDEQIGTMHRAPQVVRPRALKKI